MKYYITFYIKDQPQDSKTFKTWEEGMIFAKALDENSNLECRSRVKLIK